MGVITSGHISSVAVLVQSPFTFVYLVSGFLACCFARRGEKGAVAASLSSPEAIGKWKEDWIT